MLRRAVDIVPLVLLLGLFWGGVPQLRVWAVPSLVLLFVFTCCENGLAGLLADGRVRMGALMTGGSGESSRDDAGPATSGLAAPMKHCSSQELRWNEDRREDGSLTRAAAESVANGMRQLTNVRQPEHWTAEQVRSWLLGHAVDRQDARASVAWVLAALGEHAVDGSEWLRFRADEMADDGSIAGWLRAAGCPKHMQGPAADLIAAAATGTHALRGSSLQHTHSDPSSRGAKELSAWKQAYYPVSLGVDLVQTMTRIVIGNPARNTVGVHTPRADTERHLSSATKRLTAGRDSIWNRVFEYDPHKDSLEDFLGSRICGKLQPADLAKQVLQEQGVEGGTCPMPHDFENPCRMMARITRDDSVGHVLLLQVNARSTKPSSTRSQRSAGEQTSRNSLVWLLRFCARASRFSADSLLRTCCARLLIEAHVVNKLPLNWQYENSTCDTNWPSLLCTVFAWLCGMMDFCSNCRAADAGQNCLHIAIMNCKTDPEVWMPLIRELLEKSFQAGSPSERDSLLNTKATG